MYFLILMCCFVDSRVDIGNKSLESLSAFTQSRDTDSFTVRTITRDKKGSVINSRFTEFLFNKDKNQSLFRESCVPIDNYNLKLANATITNKGYKATLVNNNSGWVVTLIDNDYKYHNSSDGRKLPWNCYLKSVGVATLVNKKCDFKEYTQDTEGDLIHIKTKFNTKEKLLLFNDLEFWINPKHGYRLEKYVLKNGPALTVGEKTFSKTDPMVLVKEVQTASAPGTIDNITEYSFEYVDKKSDSDFYLASFGIPEPNVEIQSNYGIWILAIGAFVIIFIGLVKK